eukprot:5662251-Amphidinium_carterae.1
MCWIIAKVCMYSMHTAWTATDLVVALQTRIAQRGVKMWGTATEWAADAKILRTFIDKRGGTHVLGVDQGQLLQYARVGLSMRGPFEEARSECATDLLINHFIGGTVADGRPSMLEARRSLRSARVLPHGWL